MKNITLSSKILLLTAIQIVLKNFILQEVEVLFHLKFLIAPFH